MSSTLLLGYGGYGSNCVREFSSANSWPAVILDTHLPGLAEEDMFIEAIDVGEDESLDEVRLRNLMRDYQHILLVSSLGGDSFDKAYQTIIKCSQSLDIPIVSLCTIPYLFESDRRSRALERLDALFDTIHNMFIVDLQKTIIEDVPVDDFLSSTKTFLLNSINILINMMECGPFNSYCDSPAYTFAIGSAPASIQAATMALAHPLFDSISVDYKILACTGKELDPYDYSEIQSQLSQRNGLLPEFFCSDSLGKQDLVLFIPISCRRRE